ncbi:MAG: orotate phosphoribosyltransferase-like protein [Methanomicrobiales archaeon]|nr:orotate phosphoribosyltransferase-like protein [Methanomicrobiales archaeon]
MTDLEELIKKAKYLLSEGHSPGQIADELSLSMETVTWLLTQERGTKVPKDMLIDWTPVATHAANLNELALMLIQRYYQERGGKEYSEERGGEVILGIALSGIPLATLIALQEEARLGIYYPSKHAIGESPKGSISGNFAQVAGERVIVVDDVITSGKTLAEVVGYLRSHGATPLAILVLFDKKGLREVEGVPVYPLFRITRLG